MDLDDDPADAAFRREARAWLDANVTKRSVDGRPADPSRHHLTDDLDAAKATQAKLAAAGFAGITWPIEFGGRGGSPLQQTIFDQEANGYELPGIFNMGAKLAGPLILVAGTQKQKEHHARATLRGEQIWCQLFTEREAGSDITSLGTTARRSPGGWILNGTKVWTTGAAISDYGILLARTGPPESRHRGLTLFIVDLRADGVSLAPQREMTGRVSASVTELRDVHVDDDQVLGEPDQGWLLAQSVLARERAESIDLDFGGNPTDLRALCATLDPGRLRRDRVLRHALVDLLARDAMLRYTGLRMQTAISEGRAPGPEASIGKLISSRLLRQTAELALELEGPAGMLASDAPFDGAWQHVLCASPARRIAAGTDEIQKTVIAERVLGLPRS